MEPRGFRADRGYSYVGLERIAFAHRRALAPGVGLDQALPCLQIFERLHKVTVPTKRGAVGLDYGIAELPRGVEGQTRYDERSGRIVIELSERTYQGLERGEPRARVTVCHEIGHAHLHADLLLRTSTIPLHEMALRRIVAPPHRHFLDTEWQANSYGITLLMPARGILKLERRVGRISQADMQATFGVSKEAARIRLVHWDQRRAELI